MSFQFTQEQELFRETARDFAQKEISTLAPKFDAERKVPSDLIAKLSILGLLGVSVPQKYGGAGADFLSQLIVAEEVSRASGTLGIQIAFHNAVICGALVSSSNNALKEMLLPKLVGGFGAADLSCAIASSEDSSTRLAVTIKDSNLEVSGTSDNVLNAADASVFLVVAKITDSKDSAVLAFSKEDLAGVFDVGPEKRLLGMRATHTANLTFRNAVLPSSHLVCDLSSSERAIAKEILPRSRLAMASVSLGIAQAAIDASLKYASQRVQFKQKIGNFYAVKDMIAASETELQTARSLTYIAASKVKSGGSEDSLSRDSALAKIAASLAAVNSAKRAIRVHGGYGFMRDYPVERFARDARLAPLFPESNEELKSLLASNMLEEH